MQEAEKRSSIEKYTPFVRDFLGKKFKESHMPFDFQDVLVSLRKQFMICIRRQKSGLQVHRVYDFLLSMFLAADNQCGISYQADPADLLYTGKKTIGRASEKHN